MVVNLPFDRQAEQPGWLRNIQAPAWITGIEQNGGRFLDEPKCWHVLPRAADGVGKLIISIDREQMKESLAATVLFDAGDRGDIAVQLLDSDNRVVVVDVFGSLVDVGREATTDTFIVPLKKYPTATKIVLRRISGEVKLYGVALFPVVSEGEAIPEAMRDLAQVLGDPLSPENPLLKGVENIARNGSVKLSPVAKPASKVDGARPGEAKPKNRFKYPAATPVALGSPAAVEPKTGLLAHWRFDDGSVAAVGSAAQTVPAGGFEYGKGVLGQALKLDRKKKQAVVAQPAQPAGLKEEATVSGWINFNSLAPKWGSQILWHGDQQLGRDPLVLHLLADGTLEFRSDRSISGPKPKFKVLNSEIYLSDKGEPVQSQHVAARSPGILEPNKWYFVAGTLEKISPRLRSMSLYINGDLVSSLVTEEVVNYPTDKMWFTIGGVDRGSWQNFDGLIDDLRIYGRALSPSEIRALYQQPWR